jgi:ADP-heptose:LPS heptosyltransferase
MRRILVLRGGALGDFIVTLPALALLRRRWPSAEIELVGNATAATLALRDGLLTAASSQHERRWSALFGLGPLPRELAAWFERFDLILSYWPDPDGDLRQRFPCRSEQIFLSAPAMPACAPAAAHYCAPLRQLGLETSDFWHALRSFASRASAPPAGAASPPRTGTAVHPGSGSPQKNWPLKRWLALIPRLPPPVTVILGEAELSEWENLPGPALATVATAGPPGAEGITRLTHPPLPALAEHLARCRIFLGHDSGISHLAAACGTPCLLLFGPTAPAIWAPPAPHVRVIRRGPRLESIPLDDVLQALRDPPQAPA